MPHCQSDPKLISSVNLEEDIFDHHADKISGQSIPIKRYTWRNSNKVVVQIINYGATITSIQIPDKNGKIEDIVMGFDDMKGYLDPLNPYFGATVGRVANRIGQAKFTIDNVSYDVSPNIPPNQLHGGFNGFDKALWECYRDGNKVIMSYLSKDGEEGFPGDLITNVSFELNSKNEFLMEFQAYTTKSTVVNLTNHSYFNLAGHAKGADELYKHIVSINADFITEVDKDSIPTGNLSPVANTIFDLRIPTVLGQVIHKVPGSDGYDHNFCITKGSSQKNAFVARVIHPDSGRSLEVYSDQPGVQFYVSNGIPDRPENYKGEKGKLQTLKGKGSNNYYKHGALCLETQNYPDAINHKNFPNSILRPGHVYTHFVAYRFFVE